MPRVIVFQPALPTYRIDLFTELSRCEGFELTVAAPYKDLGVLSALGRVLPWHLVLSPTRRLPLGIEWQPGMLNFPMSADDLIVLSGAPRTVTNILVLVLCRVRGIKVMWWGHYWSGTSSRFGLFIRQIFMRLASGVLLYTDDERERCIRETRIPAKRCFSFNNGVNLTPIDVAIKNMASVQSGRYEAVGKTIIFIGRVTAKARLELLIEALAALPSNVRLIVVGDGECKVGIQRFARDLGVVERINWRPASVDEDSIATVACAADVFCYPGSVGLSLIHAFAYGLPAVVHSNRSLHMPEIAAFRDGVTGASFEPESASDLARVLERVLFDEEKRLSMGRRARAIVEESYNLKVMSARFESAVRNCMAVADY